MLFHENLGQTGFHRWICPEFERDKKSVPIAAEKAVNKLMLLGFELCFFDYPTQNEMPSVCVINLVKSDQ